jgi:hypothetical protein
VLTKHTSLAIARKAMVEHHDQGIDSSKQWRVQVFRHSPKGHFRLEAKNKNGEILPLTVRICKGLIQIPEVKLRLDLKGNGKAEDNNNNKPTLLFVRRRRDTIAIVGEGRMRKVVLKFRNETECKEFSDIFVKLNPPPLMDETQDPNSRQDESGEALTYVARLLNEPDFLSYVNDLETFLLSSEDGTEMVDALCAEQLKTDI